MELDLNDVLIFTRVVEQGSFTGAGRVLDLPKSTVSRRIARLEDRLGIRLLQRTTRKLSLTDAGRIYFDRSTRIVADFEDAELAVLELQSEPRGRLRVSMPAEFGEQIWSVLQAFLERYPQVHLELDLTNRYVDLVDEGFDAVIRAGRIADSTLIARKLISTRTLFVASPAYLERRGIPETLDALREHDCVVMGVFGHQATWRGRGPRGEVKVRVQGRLAANNLLVLKKAVLAGFGIGLLPDSLCALELEEGKLKEVLSHACLEPTPISVVYPSARHLAPKVRAFVDFLVLHSSEQLYLREHLPQASV